MDLFGIDVPLAVVASLLAAFVATGGLVVVSINDDWAERNRAYSAAFAAGVLVTTALMLIPHAVEANPNAPYVVLGGYLFLYFLNLVFQRSHGAIILPLVAIGIHSFIDGFEYGILFDHNSSLGWLASIGLISHEFAEAVILYSVLRAAGVAKSASWIGAFMGAALTTPLGAIASQPILENAMPGEFGLFLAAAAGALLYVGATHLPTHLTGGLKLRVMVLYLVGVTLAVALSVFLPHGEEADHHLSDLYALPTPVAE